MTNNIKLFNGLLIASFCMTVAQLCSAQVSKTNQPTAYLGHYNSHDTSFKCDMHEYQDELVASANASRKILVERGILPPKNEIARSQMVTVFDWPLKQATGFNQFSYYAVTNFVDQAPGSSLQDYECNARTYNNHKGTDIINWPFGWKMMTDEHVEVIAAAPGIICDKLDGQSNWSCTLGGLWNAILIEHTDGSTAWYGHLKAGSLTSKPKGATVATGEYLGLVASSGSSTYPHLHFEVADAGGTIIDPYQGPCNSTTNISWWANQKPYWEPTLNLLQTHNDLPETSTACFNTESPNFENNFEPGDLVYYAAYYHDEQSGDITNFTVKNPNGTTILNWTYTASNTQTISYQPWSSTLPTNAVEGIYSFNATYRGNTFTHYFMVGCPADLTISNQTISSDVEYQATNTITTAGSVSVYSGASTTSVQAGNYVSLTPGFTAQEGVDVQVFIGGCP